MDPKDEPSRLRTAPERDAWVQFACSAMGTGDFSVDDAARVADQMLAELRKRW
jgi:hypothetical protein